MSVNELKLLKAFMPLLPLNGAVIAGAGDDCAVLKWNHEYDLLVTVDQLIENVHFLPSTAPERAGAKLVKRNMSDIAAMGGEPLWAVMTLAAENKSQQYLERFMKGVSEECSKYGTALCGGDISSLKSEGLLTTLTLAGRVPRGQAVMRSTARPGDTLYVTGEVGNSFLSEHHLDFTPRLDLGAFLRRSATAALDISDGLLLDARRLAESSKTDIRVDIEKIPLRQGAKLPEALSDGEDYELLFCGREGLPFPAVGKVLPGTGKLIVPGLKEVDSYGFEH